MAGVGAVGLAGCTQGWFAVCLSGLWFPHRGITLLLKNFNLRKLSHKEAELQLHRNVKGLTICLWTPHCSLEQELNIYMYIYLFLHHQVEFAQYEEKFSELRQKLMNVFAVVGSLAVRSASHRSTAFIASLSSEINHSIHHRAA